MSAKGPVRDLSFYCPIGTWEKPLTALLELHNEGQNVCSIRLGADLETASFVLGFSRSSARLPITREARLTLGRDTRPWMRLILMAAALEKLRIECRRWLALEGDDTAELGWRRPRL